MHLACYLRLIATFALVALVRTVIGQSQHVQGKSFQRWGFLILENTNYADAAVNPTFQKIHSHNNSRLLSQYYAIDHPSLPNYLASIAGTTFGVKDDNPPESHSFTDSTIVDLLQSRGVSWKIYAEDYPGGCLNGGNSANSNLFAVKHVPALYFKKITTNSDRCGNIVDALQFQIDLDHGELPQWWYYIPNLKNDGHNTNLDFLASYLERQWIPRFQNQTFTKDLAMVMTFDESENGQDQNHIYAALIGDTLLSSSAPREDTTRYDHYSLLRTVEENWDLESLEKNDVGAAIISTGNGSTESSNSSSSSSPSSGAVKSAATTHVRGGRKNWSTGSIFFILFSAGLIR